MKTFLNEELKQFKDLSDEEMLAIIKAKIAGTCEVKQLAEKWECSVSDSVNINFIYRTKPPKQLVVPWEVMPKDIKFVAMDYNKYVYGFKVKPTLGVHFWQIHGKCVHLYESIAFDTDGVDFATSLVTRPEGV